MMICACVWHKSGTVWHTITIDCVLISCLSKRKLRTPSPNPPHYTRTSHHHHPTGPAAELSSLSKVITAKFRNCMTCCMCLHNECALNAYGHSWASTLIYTHTHTQPTWNAHQTPNQQLSAKFISAAQNVNNSLGIRAVGSQYSTVAFNMLLTMICALLSLVSDRCLLIMRRERLLVSLARAQEW